MADRKISDLTALTTPASGDYLPIVDISEAAAASKNKRITIEELFRGVPDGTVTAPAIARETDSNTGIFFPAADTAAISAGGSEIARATSNLYIRLASGTGGIQFNGDTAAVNALDDYEEGTWTPVFSGGSGVPNNMCRTGNYVKIGRIVTVNMWATNTCGGVGATFNQISGFPFTAASNNTPFGNQKYSTATIFKTDADFAITNCTPHAYGGVYEATSTFSLGTTVTTEPLLLLQLTYITAS